MSTAITYEYCGARGDTRSVHEILSTPIPRQQEVAKGIRDLTDTIFDRLDPQIRKYGRDSRRVGETGSIGLHSSYGTLNGPNNRYGHLLIKAVNRASYTALAEVINNDRDFNDHMKDSMDSHWDMFIEEKREKNIARPYDRFTFLGGYAIFTADRDEYIRGKRSNNRLFVHSNPANVNPEERIEAHEIGLTIKWKLSDKLDPSRPARWTFSQTLKTRGDEDRPVNEYLSTYEGLVDTREDIRYREFKKEIITEENANWMDLAFMQHLLNTAKDLRPIVEPIDSYVANTEAVGKILRSIYDSDKPKQS